MSYTHDTLKFWPCEHKSSNWFSRKYFSREYSLQDWRTRTWRILWQRAENSPSKVQTRWRQAYNRFQACRKPNYRGMYGWATRKTIYHR